MAAKTYYKVTSSLEFEMAGAGLGYEEVYGNGARYFWSEDTARRRAAALNVTGSDDLRGAYSVEERRCYDDGSYDDDGDPQAECQLGLSADVEYPV